MFLHIYIIALTLKILKKFFLEIRIQHIFVLDKNIALTKVI